MARQYDSYVHGRINTAFDSLTDSVNVNINHSDNNVIVIDGEEYVKRANVETLYCENEWLRETLFISLADNQEWAITVIKRHCNQSTSEIKKMVKTIVLKTYNILTEKDVYSALYKILATYFSIDTAECPSNKSKLQWIWEEGHLPILSLATNIFYFVLIELHNYDNTEEFKSFCKGLKGVEKKIKKILPF